VLNRLVTFSSFFIHFSDLFHTKIDVPDFKGGRPLTKKMRSKPRGLGKRLFCIILVIMQLWFCVAVFITRIMLLSFGAFETTYFCVIAKQLFSSRFLSGSAKVLFIG